VKLHPDAAEVLARIREAGVPPWHTLTPVVGREVYRKRASMFEGERLDVGTVADRVIPGPAGDVPIRVYRPVGAPRPIFVYLHGGGWTLGDLDTHDTVCRRLSLAAFVGFVCSFRSASARRLRWMKTSPSSFAMAAARC